MNANKIAKQLIKRGFNVIPTNASKNPVGVNWSKFQKEGMRLEDVDNYFKPNYYVAILTGGVTRVVCLDADMKYDLSKDLWDRFYIAVPKYIKDQCMLQKTQNGGYHLIFRAPSTRLFGNEKLASRPTTADEKHWTYVEAFQDIETKDKALKIAINDSERVLFETRSGSADSCGGYFLVNPSPGYEYIEGKIGELTEEMYDELIDIARSFEQVKRPIKNADYVCDWELSPFEDYNQSADVLSLLVDNGWKILPSKGKDTRLLRPGRVSSASSAVFDNDSKVLNVHTSSTSFKPTNKTVGEGGYSPAGVFIQLECEGDKSLAFRKLVEMGYGKEKI